MTGVDAAPLASLAVGVTGKWGGQWGRGASVAGRVGEYTGGREEGTRGLLWFGGVGGKGAPEDNQSVNRLDICCVLDHSR